MATVRQFIYTSTGTEIDFIQGVVDTICALDSGITLEDASGNIITVSQFFADTNNQFFYLNFGVGNRLQFKRWFIVGNPAQSYIVGNRALPFSGGNQSYNTPTTRRWYFSIIQTDDFIWIGIGDQNGTVITAVQTSAVLIKHGQDRYFGFFDGYDIFNKAFVGANTIYLAKIFNYQQSVGQIDYTTKTPVCTGSMYGVKVFELTNVWSCMTTNIGTSFALQDGKRLYAIGTNAVVDVTEE